MDTLDQINQIPAWKRWLICTFLRRKQWKLARAYNAVAVHEINHSRDDLGWVLGKRGERLWAELYRVPSPQPEPFVDWRRRALDAEFDLQSARRALERAENKLELMKNTARGLSDARRSRPLPI